jgi:phage N-6-adenine-methyltransferase
MTALVRYEAARKALAEAHSVDEVEELHDRAAQLQASARVAKDMQLIQWSTEIRLRAVRKIGELMEAQREAGLMHIGGRPRKTGSVVDPVFKEAITLDEAGIDKHLADKARKFAARTDDEFETFLGKALQKVSDGIEGRRPNTADDDWFTPPEYLELARRVLGEIDLDPASHREAQKVVQAADYFTQMDDGLKKEWRGKIWLNPPYSRLLIGQFIDKLVSEVDAGRVSQAILLANSYTDTSWFHKAAKNAAAICFTRGRIHSVALDGRTGSPTEGQAFFYFGKDPQRFADEFSALGLIGSFESPAAMDGAL